MVVEIFDVGVAREEAKQLINDRLEMQFLGRDQRKAFRQIETHLMAKDRDGPGAGAVALLHAVSEDVLHQVVILAHDRLISVRLAGTASLALQKCAKKSHCRPRSTGYPFLQFGAFDRDGGHRCALPWASCARRYGCSQAGTYRPSPRPIPIPTNQSASSFPSLRAASSTPRRASSARNCPSAGASRWWWKT